MQNSSTFLTNVIIVEDNADLRLGYKFMIDNMPNYFVSGAFERCEDALLELIALKPHIVIMDIDLPGMNGIEGTAKIKALLPDCNILMNTIFENSQRVFDALCAGATGYITKSSGHKEIFFALEELKKGGAPMSANIARLVVQSFQRSHSPILKEREHQVLAALSVGKSYKSIALEVQISLDTVKFHIKNIYQKLEVNNKEDAITIAKGHNWI